MGGGGRSKVATTELVKCETQGKENIKGHAQVSGLAIGSLVLTFTKIRKIRSPGLRKKKSIHSNFKAIFNYNYPYDEYLMCIFEHILCA